MFFISQQVYYEWEVVPQAQYFNNYKYISFRGAQGTQHPNTLEELGDLTFSLTLRDGSNASSSINIGAYGGGLEQPYQRQGGWHNEMERIHIRITDFLTNGSGLDLTNINAVRLDVGSSWGSGKGRIVIDELMLSGYNMDLITGIANNDQPQIQNIQLNSFPNPFSTSTLIELDIPEDYSGQTPVSIDIYDLTGKKVAMLYSGNPTGGTLHKFTWNCVDLNNRQVQNGVYFVKANISGKIITCKLTLLR